MNWWLLVCCSLFLVATLASILAWHLRPHAVPLPAPARTLPHTDREIAAHYLRTRRWCWSAHLMAYLLGASETEQEARCVAFLSVLHAAGLTGGECEIARIHWCDHLTELRSAVSTRRELPPLPRAIREQLTA